VLSSQRRVGFIRQVVCDTSIVLFHVQHGRLLPVADVVRDPVHGVVAVLPRVLHALSVSDAHAHVPPDHQSVKQLIITSFTLGESVLLQVTTVNELSYS